MVYSLTESVDATHAGTRVPTLVIDTCFLTRTVIVRHTLRPTSNVRIAKVVWQTGAGADAVALFAHRV